MTQSPKKNKGFTLLELLVTIFVITVGVVGVYAIYSRIISYTTLSISRLTASYLAQEGIEIVRNIRDTNWVADRSWNVGLGAGDWEADYVTTTLDDDYDGDPLRINDGFFNYTSGIQTKFKRKITITAPGDILEVKVKVIWEEKGKSYEVEVQENLYNWFR